MLFRQIETIAPDWDQLDALAHIRLLGPRSVQRVGALLRTLKRRENLGSILRGATKVSRECSG